MFFISWGSKTISRYLGAAEPRYCEVCEKERNFRTVLTYRRHHVLWLCRWVTGKTYASACEICGRGQTLPTREFEAKLAKPAVPLIDRFGWAFFLGLIALLSVAVMITDKQTQAQELGLLQHPQINDIYEVDAARMEKNPEAPVMYSTLRVRVVTPEFVGVQFSKRYFNRLSGVTRDVSSGATKADDYYADVDIKLPRATLAKMRTDGWIVGVVR